MIEKGVVKAKVLDRTPFLKMLFFQYMISNTDWNIKHKHNMEIVKFKDQNRLAAIPYDFDYSGFVGTDYAIAHPSFPVLEVSQRYFRVNNLSEEEMDISVAFFNNIRDDMEQMLDDEPYLNDESKREIKKSISSFYKTINSSKKRPEFVMKNPDK